MKTSKSNSSENAGNIQVTESILLTVACLFMVFISSCKKDNPLTPVSQQTVKNELRDGGILPRTFEMIKINHDANLSVTPDYSVTIRSDGLVTYEGRSRVGVKGKVQFDVSSEMLKKLDALFALPSISRGELVSEARNECHDCQPHPIITTTYSNGREIPKIWIDFNTGYPLDVVYRRSKVEEYLGISKYVKITSPVVLNVVEAEL